MYTDFVKYIQHLDNSDCKILLHHNADPDAVCAAEALGLLLQEINNDLNFSLYADSANFSSTRIIDTFSIEVNEDTPEWDMAKKHIIITIDTANFSQLGKYQNWADQQNAKLLVIDHHDTNEIMDQAESSIVDEEASSTCIMITNLFEELEIKPSSRTATLLVSGHVYDSRRFLYGSSEKLFQQISWLISCGGDYELANEVLQNDMSHGERIARLKAASRLSYHSIGNEIIIVTSRVGAFEASVARNFIGMGADAALVLASRSDELRGSGRVVSSLGINMGEIMSILAEEFNGTGGGHAAAAGFNIKGSVSRVEQNNILSRFVEIVSKEVSD